MTGFLSTRKLEAEDQDSTVRTHRQADSDAHDKLADGALASRTAAHDVLSLQRMAGNAAVAGLLAREPQRSPLDQTVIARQVDDDGDPRIEAAMHQPIDASATRADFYTKRRGDKSLVVSQLKFRGAQEKAVARKMAPVREAMIRLAGPAWRQLFIHGAEEVAKKAIQQALELVAEEFAPEGELLQAEPLSIRVGDRTVAIVKRFPKEALDEKIAKHLISIPTAPHDFMNPPEEASDWLGDVKEALEWWEFGETVLSYMKALSGDIATMAEIAEKEQLWDVKAFVEQVREMDRLMEQMATASHQIDTLVDRLDRVNAELMAGPAL